MATATQAAPSTAPSSTAPENGFVDSGTSPPTRQQAEAAIGKAWESHKQNGLEFGRQCYEWGEKFKAQGSRHGSTFQNVLNSLDIPRHIADFWSMKYRASLGDGIPCDHCTKTFPSRTQWKRHQHKAHPQTMAAPVYPISDYSQHPEAQATTGSRSHGMGLDRLRKQAEESSIDCKVSYSDDTFTVKCVDGDHAFKDESDARAFIMSLVPPTATAAPAVEDAPPSAPATSNKKWTPAGEKRKNRSEPMQSEAAVIALALKIIDAGYEALKTSEDPSHLHAAMQLAKLNLEHSEVIQ